MNFWSNLLGTAFVIVFLTVFAGIMGEEFTAWQISILSALIMLVMAVYDISELVYIRNIYGGKDE